MVCGMSNKSHGLCPVIADVSLKTIHKVKVPCAARVFDVPRELIQVRKRFVAIPEVFPELIRQSYKPSLISTIDIKLPPKNPWR